MRLWLLFILLPLTSKSQSYFRDHVGASVTIYSSIGTHNTGIGAKINTWYQDHFYQITLSNSIRLFALNYGDRKNYVDNKFSIGLLLLGGKKEQQPSPFSDVLLNKSIYNNSFGYSYMIYLDNRGTSQSSGAFLFGTNNFELYLENDVFAGTGRDRFRTGAISASYRYDQYKFSIGSRIWTGETRGAKWQELKGSDHPYGFKIIEDLPYGKTSSGTLYLGASYYYGFSQWSSVELGIDSENIRNFIQNRIVHDLIFLPKKIERTTPHYPRLDEHGCPAFDKKDAKKDRLYYQVGTGFDSGY